MFIDRDPNGKTRAVSAELNLTSIHLVSCF